MSPALALPDEDVRERLRTPWPQPYFGARQAKPTPPSRNMHADEGNVIYFAAYTGGGLARLIENGQIPAGTTLDRDLRQVVSTLGPDTNKTSIIAVPQTPYLDERLGEEYSDSIFGSLPRTTTAAADLEKAATHVFVFDGNAYDTVMRAIFVNPGAKPMFVYNSSLPPPPGIDMPHGNVLPQTAAGAFPRPIPEPVEVLRRHAQTTLETYFR